MNVDFINPIVSATCNVFATMMQMELKRGELKVMNQFQTQHDVSGVISLSGKASGTVIVSLESQVAMQATGAMLGGAEVTEVDQDVVDAIGELANMIAGGAKSQLEALAMTLSLPTVIVGKSHKVGFDKQVRPLCIPFQCEWGELAIIIGLSMTPAATAS